jgi:hypothetical protein
MELWNIIEQLLVAVLTVSIPVITKFVVDWLKAQRDLLQLRFDEKEWLIIVNFTNLMIEAAEQSGLAGHISDAGEAKKAFVLAQVQAFLEDNGIDVDVDRLSDLIEALVYGNLNWQRNQVED